MHKNFAEWYRQVRIEPNGTLLNNRWAGVREWNASLSEEDDEILEAVRIFQGMPEVASREPFLAVFRKHDPAFPQRNELELQVLAGAVLAQCVAQTDDDSEEAVRSAVIAGSALQASRFRQADSQPSEVEAEVIEALHGLARRQRKRYPSSTTLISSEAEAAAKAAMKQIPTAADWTAFRAHAQAVLDSVLNGVLEAERVLATAAHNQLCADEEANILWWLEGGCSRDLNKPWSTLRNELPLVSGWELADLTEIALGPRDVAAFLERVVAPARRKAKQQQSLHQYVNAVSDDWARRRTANIPEGALDLAPLTLALLQRSKSGINGWRQYFEQTGGVPSTMPLAPEVVAKQAYIEAVLLRTLAA